MITSLHFYGNGNEFINTFIVTLVFYYFYTYLIDLFQTKQHPQDTLTIRD